MDILGEFDTFKDSLLSVYLFISVYHSIQVYLGISDNITLNTYVKSLFSIFSIFDIFRYSRCTARRTRITITHTGIVFCGIV